MQVRTFPVRYSGDWSALPLVYSDGGAALIPIKLEEWLDYELLQGFIKANRAGCQFVELRHTAPILEETLWRNI